MHPVGTAPALNRDSLFSPSLGSSIAGARPYTTAVSGSRPPLAGGGSSIASSAVGRSRTQPSTVKSVPQLQMPPPGGAATRARAGAPGAAKGGPSQEQEASTVDRLFDLMMAEEAEFVGDVEKMIKLRERVGERKKRMLYNEWESAIYEKVQDQVTAKVNARNTRDLSNRNAALMQRYIDVSNAKAPYGCFRDIIIPAEYDPMHAHELTRLTFDPCTERDPCKLELRKHAPVPGTVERAFAWNVGNERAARGGAVPRLPCLMWDKLESTPYGRLGKVVPNPDAPKYKLMNNVQHSNYNIELGYHLVKAELPRGKRCGPVSIFQPEKL